MIDALQNAGQITFEDCSIFKRGDAAGTNVINLVDGIVIYEDIFSPFITGRLSLRDTHDLPNLFGRSGNDVLRLKLFTPSIDKSQYIQGDFLIYKMADRAVVKDRTQIYNYYFASIELLVDINTRLSKQYQGAGHTVVRNIYSASLGSNKKLISDNCKNTVSYVSNFWTPTKNFNFISDHSVGPTGSPTMMFFENRDGFNFRDVSGIIGNKKSAMQTFSGSDFTADVVTEGSKMGAVTRNPKQDYSSIHGIRVDVTYDYLKDYTDGAIKSKLYSVDPTTKKIRWNTFSLNNWAADGNKQKLYSREVIEASNPVIMSKNRGYGTFGLRESSNYQTTQHRVGYMRLLQASKIEIDCYGRTDYTVGKRVTLELNQLKSIVKTDNYNDILDKLYSGAYIVTAVSHQINRESHKCTLELCKESTLLV